MIKKEVTLSVRNVSKAYPGAAGHEVKALRDVSFDLYSGELLAVMGTSGSGKSTLLNILGALDQPDQGVVTLKGKVEDQMFTEPYATRYRRENIGFIFQSFNLLKDLTAEENIALPLILQGVPHAEVKDKVQQMVELLGLNEWRGHRPAQLSGGQQQRVAIGRALIMAPPIVLADEPTGNLDFNTSTTVLHTLVEMKERLDQSMIVVTHDPYVATHADRVFFFHDGQVVDEYTCDQDKENMEYILQKFRNIIGS